MSLLIVLSQSRQLVFRASVMVAALLMGIFLINSLAAPQPENVMPGYGTYPTVQPNPYVGNPASSVPDYQRGYAGAPATTT